MAGPQFTPDGARRVRAAVLAYEKSPRNVSIPPRARYPILGAGGGSGGGRVAKVAAGGISAATSIIYPGSGDAVIHDYGADPPVSGSTIEVKNPFKVSAPADATIIVTLCGTAWVLTAMECGS